MEPGLFRQCYEELLPESMSGAAFLARYGDHWDEATQVQPNVDYPVQQATLHPINENFRVQAFETAMSSAPDKWQSTVLGSLMYQARRSLLAVWNVSTKLDSPRAVGGTWFGPRPAIDDSSYTCSRVMAAGG